MKTKKSGFGIYLIVILTFAMIMGAVLYIVHSETNTIASELTLNHAHTANVALVQSISELHIKSLERAKIIAENEFVIGDLKGKDYNVLEKTLLNLGEGIDFASICDSSGTVLAKTTDGTVGGNISEYTAVSKALSTGVASTSVEMIPDVGLSLYASAAIYDGDEIIGAVSCNFDLTRNEYLDVLKKQFNCEASICYGDERINSTIMDDYGNRIIGMKSDKEIVQTVIGNKSEYTGRVDILGRTYQVSYSPLMNGDEAIGMLFIGIDISTTMHRQRIMNYWIIIVAITGIGATAVFIAVLNKFANRVADTLVELSEKEASLNTLKNIMDSAEAFLYVSDLHTDELIFVNTQMREYFGISDDSTGKACWEAFRSGFKRCEFCPKYKLTGDSAEDVVIWEEYNEVTGRYYRSHDSVINWFDGRKVHLQERYDITDMKQAQETLLQMSRIIQSSPDFISYIDADGKCVFLNPAAADITGYSRSELVGNNISILFDDETLDYIKNTVMPEVIRNGGMTFEVRLRRKDGQTRIFSALSFLLESKEIAIGTIASDITEKKRIEAEKEDALEKAEQASRAKSNFLSRMSHEMRTPMNAVIGMTNIAKSTNDIERKDYCLDKIDNASTHLLGIINDILDMSKIEANKFELYNSEFNFEKMLIRVVNVINFRVEEKNQILTVNIDRKVPGFIVGDEQRLAQVITNLLANAVKFTHEGGKITLNATVDGISGDVYTIRTEISDNGIGMSEEQQARLFTSFEQADGGIARKYGGTGLGLAISKRIVEMMEGTIWIESKLGEGAKFIFTVKVKKGKTQSRTSLSSNINKERLNVLVVDDAPEIREYFSHVMKEYCISCDTAENGFQALDMIKNSRDKAYNLFFLDWDMPGMDGITLAKKINETADAKPCVIIISAADWSEIEKEASSAGITRFIQKTLFPSIIIDTINECFTGVDEFEETATEDVYDESSADFSGHTLLLAEDVEINREIVEAILSDTGALIESAENGKTAFEMYRNSPERYSLILMDIHMPEMDGYEAARSIRSLDFAAAKEIPIVAMTANVFREDIEMCLAAGMNDHIGKPIDTDDLFATLSKYLGAKP